MPPMTPDERAGERPARTRYGKGGPSTGSNEPKRHERKERDPDWESRQGGDQSRPGTGSGGQDEPKPR